MAESYWDAHHCARNALSVQASVALNLYSQAQGRSAIEAQKQIL